MSNHIEFKGKIIGDGVIKVHVGGQFVVVVVKRVQPLVLRLNRRLDHELRGRVLNLAVPAVQQIKFLVLSAFGLDKPDMLFDLKAVVLKVDELHALRL